MLQRGTDDSTEFIDRYFQQACMHECGIVDSVQDITGDTQVLHSSLARLTGAGKSLVGMDLSGASAALQSMGRECRCPLEMLLCINEADRCLTESANKLRHDSCPSMAVLACLEAPLCL